MSTVRFAYLLLILIAGLQGAAPSQAAPPENKKPDYGPVTIDYARTYGVSFEEAESRLSKSKYIAAMGRRIEADSPETFAGIWIEHEPVFRVVVRFVGDAKAQLAKYTQDPLFVPQTAPRSYEVLVAAQRDIAERLAKDGIDFTSGIDIKKSEITLYVQDPVMVLRKYAVIFTVSPFIHVYKGGESVELTEISGGERAKYQIAPLTPGCTTGFNVFDASRELGVVTAGHCENALIYAPTNTRLDYQDEKALGNYDVQWNKQRVTQSSTPEQQKNTIDLMNGPMPSMDITSTTPSTDYTIGEHVCKSGIITGYNCGDVVDMNHLEIFGPNNEVGSYIEVHNANNEEMNVKGDSGGPVFGNNAAYGVIHGRPKKNKPDHNDLLFMPIERFSILGVSVLTEPFEITSIPDASGPNGVVPITVNFKGIPRFPMTVTVDVPDCPQPWTCTSGSGEITTNVPSPIGIAWTCDNEGGLPTTSFLVQTTLKDASLIQTGPVQHTVTCVAGLAGKSQHTQPAGKAGVVFDHPQLSH